MSFCRFVVAVVVLAHCYSPVAADPPYKLAALQAERIEAPTDIIARTPSESPSVWVEVSEDAHVQVFGDNGFNEILRKTGRGIRKLNNLKEGWYAIIAQTRDTIAAMPIEVRFVPAQTDSPTIRMRETPGRTPAHDQAELFLPVVTPDSPVSLTTEGEPGKRHDYTVRLTRDGRMLGQVITRSEDGRTMQAAANNNLVLLKEGRRVQTSESDINGEFDFANITPGVYGIVAAGPGGFTAFAFEATNTQFTKLDQQGRRFVARQVDPEAAEEDRLPVVMIPPALNESLIKELRDGKCR